MAGVVTEPTLRVPRLGAAVVTVLAATLTAVDAIVLSRYDVDAVWAWLQVPVLALAWVAPFAWVRRRWVTAGLCLLATLGGLWGYFYLPPLAALVMAVVAFWRGATGDRPTRATSARAVRR
jgi:hypothetical protein